MPNFFIAGVPKAGTTSLYHYLDQHSDIFVSPVKEPGFFAAADFASHRFAKQILGPARQDAATLRRYLTASRRPKRQHGLVLQRADYLDLFRDARNERAVGEATVSYFTMPGVPRNIRAEVPDARIILILRDPADRLFSQYLASDDFKRGRSFADCYAAALNDENLESTWLDNSRYATHAGRFLRAFPAAQISIHLYEDFRKDPAATLRELFAFLGVDHTFRVDVSRRYNRPLAPRSRRLYSLTERLTRSRAARLVPEDLRAPARRLFYRHATERMSPDDRARVIEHARPEIEQLAQLLDRDLSAWLR